MSSYIERLAGMCCNAANAAADTENFVSVQRLVDLLDVEFRAQPLLYEGMVAEPKSKDDKWLVVVDSLSSGYEADIYQAENRICALPPRVRFTIAHELSHVLQLRCPEESSSGRRSKVKVSKGDIEKKKEREADALSPLLLIPDDGFSRLCFDTNDRLNIDRLVEMQSHFAVSREVIVNRFGILPKYDPNGFRFKPAIQDIIIGAAEWTSKSTARIVSWPKSFCNFSENLLPEFMQINHLGDSLNTVFQDSSFIINGGDCNECLADVFLGTAANPLAEKVTVRLAVEETRPASGRKFLFILDKLDSS